MAARIRDCRGSWTKKANTINYAKPERIKIVKPYYATDSYVRSGDSTQRITSQNHIKPWKIGRRIVELRVLLEKALVDIYCAFVNCVSYGKTDRIKSGKL
ncbi:hypothetical protein MAR_024562 [Mya arenaria]|uniref:Uncharacterized protein n=1 Tax=Mya arenaria TaxID=6604 RepID=A0ABY7DU97_MYAAR|nr:hypothetical protein MAR_024562 [Mya arenaria]